MDEIDKMKITIVKNGPYLVEGNIPLVKKTQIVSEYGEPLTWQTLDKIEAPTGSYALCRCGNSQHKYPPLSPPKRSNNGTSKLALELGIMRAGHNQKYDLNDGDDQLTLKLRYLDVPLLLRLGGDKGGYLS